MPMQIVQEGNIDVNPQMTEEEKIALENDKGTLHKELDELKAADVRVLVESKRFRQVASQKYERNRLVKLLKT